MKYEQYLIVELTKKIKLNRGQYVFTVDIVKITQIAEFSFTRHNDKNFIAMMHGIIDGEMKNINIPITFQMAMDLPNKFTLIVLINK